MFERISQYWQTWRGNTYAPYGVLILLFAFAAWTIYTTTKLFIELQTPLPPSTFVAPPTKTGDLIKSVQDIHIFGIANFGPPEAGAGMKLMGIFLSWPLDDSRVLIALTGQAAQSYKMGDVLPNGARVYQVLPDSVVLVQDGKLVKIMFPLKGLEFSDTPPNSGLFTNNKGSNK